METDRLYDRQERFDFYIGHLAAQLGHEDRAGPLKLYCMGLLLPGERKSIEPMAALMDPEHVSARHQSLHHFINGSPWCDQTVIHSAARWTLDGMNRHGGITAWIVDDTGVPKKGQHSVGVARQYCGILGKQENCQVSVSLSMANDMASCPLAFQLYLPADWATDEKRRKKAKVPETIAFQTKWQISLAQIKSAIAGGFPQAPVVCDAGYGNTTDYREGIREMGLDFMAGVQSSLSVWPEGRSPLPAKIYKGTGRPPKLLRRSKKVQPISVKNLALGLAKEQFQMVTWRQGADGIMRSRFAAVRVRSAHEDMWRSEPYPEDWLLIEWPPDEPEPTKYWISSLRQSSNIKALVALAKIRWRIERDYQELKSELGLDHFEGRSWRGFHHHASLCIAAYAFLVSERLAFSPLKADKSHELFEILPLSEDYSPRGQPGRASPKT